MKPEDPDQFPTLASFGAELERAAAALPGRGAGIHRRPLLLAAAAVVVALALFGTLTGPGRAVAGGIGELIGIGGDSTLDHAEDHPYPARGRGIVIAAGTVPKGPDYEIVAFANEPKEAERKYVGGSSVATCLSLDFPAIEKNGGFDTTCFGAGERSVLHTSGSSDHGPDGDLGPVFRYTVGGETSPAVASVRVTYLDDDGKRVEAPVAYGVADDDVLAAIDGEYPGGEFVAFVPDDGAGSPATDGPSVLDSVEVTALDADGNVLATDDWGAQISGARERSAAQGAQRVERFCREFEERSGGQPPPICTDDPSPDPEPERTGSRGDLPARIDLLWQQVIDKAEAGELAADVDPAEVVRVMRMAQSPPRQAGNRLEQRVIAMVEKLREAGDLPPVGTPLPKLPEGTP